MSCKDEYENVLKEINNESQKIDLMNRDEVIKEIKDIIEHKGAFPSIGNLTDLTDIGIRSMLKGLRSKNWVRKEDGVLCKCIRDDGLSQDNVKEIVGEKNAQFARNALRVLKY